jgi:hypothetical protein
MARATAQLVQRADGNAIEMLRQVMTSWATGDAPPSVSVAAPADSSFTAIGIVRHARRVNLVAVIGNRVSDRPTEVLRATEALGSSVPSGGGMDHSEVAPALMEPLLRWLDEMRGRDLARPAVDAPSAAHASVLRALQQRLNEATRFERATLAGRVERCRRLVLSARGVGAERELERLASSAGPFDLDALEARLCSRQPPDVDPDPPALLAVLCRRPQVDGGLGALCTTGLMAVTEDRKRDAKWHVDG